MHPDRDAYFSSVERWDNSQRRWRTLRSANGDTNLRKRPSTTSPPHSWLS